MTEPTNPGAGNAPDKAETKAEDTLLSWVKSFKVFAALTGVLAGIWALFPSFYMQGFLVKLGLPVSTFPVDTLDTSMILHRVMMSVLLNFLVVLPTHKAYLGMGAFVCGAIGLMIWFAARRRERKKPALIPPKWRPSPAAVGLGAAIWGLMIVYLLPRAVMALVASLVFLPYIAEYAGRWDAESVMAKIASCSSAPRERPVECVSVRYEEKGPDGKETIEQLDGIVAMGNGKSMAMLTPDGEARIVPANVIRLSTFQPSTTSK